jgi:hypothetical protein
MPQLARARTAVAAGAAAVLLLVIGAVLAVRLEPVRRYMVSVTGEEDTWEGAKGVVALTLLRLTSRTLSLEPDAPIDHLGVGQVGANTFLQLEADPENVRRTYASLRDAGVTWARQQFPWEDIEIHGKGDFQDRRNEPPRSAWEKYDRIVAGAKAHGIELLVRLDDPPDWAYADPAASGSMGPPDDLEDYGDFVAAVAKRYCGRVRYYQLWNEPNIYPEWGERSVDPAGYAALLRIGAQRVRAACPDAFVVSAALAQTTEPGGRNMDDLAYLQALYDAGWRDDFDVLATQGFGLWTGPLDRRASASRANFARVQLAREVMVRNGDAAKPVWITEMGWDSPPAEQSAPYGRVTEETRARYTLDAYDRMAREWPWAGVGFLWFFRRPNWEWHAQPQGYFRLVEPDWTTTAAWQALSQRSREAPALGRGRHGPWDVGLRFSGPTRVADTTSVTPTARTLIPTAEVQFLFDGTGWRAFADGPSPDAGPAQLTVVIDGKRLAVQPELADDGTSRVVWTVSGLPEGTHLATIRVDAGELPLDEIRVMAADPKDPLTPVWLALLSAACSVALVVAVAARAWRKTARSDG